GRFAIVGVDHVADRRHAEDEGEQSPQAVDAPLEERPPLGRGRLGMMALGPGGVIGIALHIGISHRAAQVANLTYLEGLGASAAGPAWSTRAWASARGARTVAPDARRWPPPPNCSATRATSTSRERKLTLMPPRGCSMKNRPTSTPSMPRV